MTDKIKGKIPLTMQGIDLPVFQAPGNTKDGIAFGQMGNEVFIAISLHGEAFYVRLNDMLIDQVANQMAICMEAATQDAFPSLGGVQ